MARKEWELLFNLSAKQNSSFSSTFKAAQSALVETQGKIQQLNKVQSDISAYQKQQQAVDATRQRLSVLQQQYDNIQKEIQETEGYSSALENKLLSKQAQIDKTTASLNTYEQRLAATGNALHEAGVDTTMLIGFVISFVLTAVLTYMLGFDEGIEKDERAIQAEKKAVKLH